MQDLINKNTIIINKKYGVKKLYSGRYAIIIDAKFDIKLNRWLWNTTDLNYARADFALLKAERFIKRIYTDFYRDMDNKFIKFTFESIGIQE